ncbi:calcium-binding protein [Tistrella bauzanensis]
MLVETADASAVLAALGLPAGTDLGTFDPLAALGGAEDALARDVLAQGHMVYATLAALQAVQDGVTDMEAADRALDLLGDRVATGETIDLADLATLDGLLTAAAGTDAVAADISRMADALAAINARLDTEMAADPLSSTARATALLADQVLPGEIAALAAGTADDGAADRLAARYGADLDALITRLADVLPDVAAADAKLVAAADVFSVARGDSLTLTPDDATYPVADDVALADGAGTLTLVSVSVPAAMAGEIAVTLDPDTGALTITPDRTFFGTTAFTYVVEDALGNRAEGLVLVDVPAWRAGAGDDLLIGTDGADRIDGLDGADIILPGAGEDTVFGGAGDDLIVGTAGPDHLSGGSGADRIVAGHAAGEAVDLFGGSGADRFILAPREADGALDLAVTIADFSGAEGIGSILAICGAPMALC